MPHRTLVDGVEWIRDDWDDQYGHGVNILTGRIERHCSWDGVWELKKELVASAWDGMGVSSLRACGCLRAIPIESKSQAQYSRVQGCDIHIDSDLLKYEDLIAKQPYSYFLLNLLQSGSGCVSCARQGKRKGSDVDCALAFICHSNLPSPFVVVGQSAVPPYHLHHYHHPASPAQPPRHPQQPPRVPPSSTTTTKQLSTTIQSSIT